ncbi:hypothetical protein RND81_05G105000 [Saponaria officinalis]|uniref:Uncharacterized protein n=1 Tax=Saponaria officinalis TaxID=3572 RepID=A0AAW1KS28_SAPOF
MLIMQRLFEAYICLLLCRFKKRDNFLYEESLPSEKAYLLEFLQKALRTTKDPKAVQEMNDRISWIKDLEIKSCLVNKCGWREVKRSKPNRNLSHIADIQKQRLFDKYNDLEATGKLSSFIQKKSVLISCRHISIK